MNVSKKNLSVIIPCYNCSKTIEEAVDSCFVQGLDNFEIIMVDDGSTDNTKDIIRKLADKHPEIKLFFHDENQGGGATRNTAVKHSDSEIIFCLDSDDILPEKTLSKMLTFIREKKCDGVCVHRSIKFKGKDINNIVTTHTFGYVGEKIPFESLLEKNGILCPLYSTFMFSRKAFDVFGGYPVKHGFDTQGFAWRFLMHGFSAYTCPDTEYLHRVNFHPSYYIREYNAGRINYNWQQVLEEFIFVFSKEAQELIVNFNLLDTDNSLINKLTQTRSPWRNDIQEIIGRDISKNITEKINTNMDKELYFQMKKNKNTTFKPLSRNSFKGLIKRLNKKLFKYLYIISNIVSTRNYRLNLLFYFFILKLKKFFKFGFDPFDGVLSKVDVVIPTVLKDESLLSKMIEALKINLNHNINNIYIVSKDSPDMRNFCDRNGYVFIEETTVLGYGKEKINYNYNGLNRSGWMFQQLLKLSGDKFTGCDDYIIIDSDTLLINKHSFKINNRYVFFEGEEWHESYFKSYKKIFGYRPKNRLSFTCHMMIFNRQYLKQMKNEMEKLHNKKWDDVYLDTINDKEMSCTSDYDTYANWVLHNHPEKVLRLPFYNKSMSRSQLENVEILSKKHGDKFKSLSFHSYFEKDIKEIIKDSK